MDNSSKSFLDYMKSHANSEIIRMTTENNDHMMIQLKNFLIIKKHTLQIHNRACLKVNYNENFYFYLLLCLSFIFELFMITTYFVCVDHKYLNKNSMRIAIKTYDLSNIIVTVIVNNIFIINVIFIIVSV